MKFLVRVLNRLGLLKYVNLTIQHQQGANGRRINVPVIQSFGRENLYLSEPWMGQLIEQLFVLKKGIFMDVGVNVGQTLIKLKSKFPEAGYIGFEPNPACVFYAKELVRHNQFKDTLIVPVGLAEKNELLSLYFYADGDLDSSASIIENFRPEKVYRREFVPCFDFKSIDFVLEKKRVSIIKIDVEGAELTVLKSLDELIAKERPFILIEVLPVYTLDNKPRLERQQAIEKMLKQLDYAILRVNKKSEQFSGFDKLHEFGLTKEVALSDYVFCPIEELANVLR